MAEQIQILQQTRARRETSFGCRSVALFIHQNPVGMRFVELHRLRQGSHGQFPRDPRGPRHMTTHTAGFPDGPNIGSGLMPAHFATADCTIPGPSFGTGSQCQTTGRPAPRDNRGGAARIFIRLGIRASSRRLETPYVRHRRSLTANSNRPLPDTGSDTGAGNALFGKAAEAGQMPMQICYAED